MRRYISEITAARLLRERKRETVLSSCTNDVKVRDQTCVPRIQMFAVTLQTQPGGHFSALQQLNSERAVKIRYSHTQI